MPRILIALLSTTAIVAWPFEATAQAIPPFLARGGVTYPDNQTVVGVGTTAGKVASGPALAGEVTRAQAAEAAALQSANALSELAAVSATARANLGSAKSGANSDITGLSGLTSFTLGGITFTGCGTAATNFACGNDGRFTAPTLTGGTLTSGSVTPSGASQGHNLGYLFSRDFYIDDYLAKTDENQTCGAVTISGTTLTLASTTASSQVAGCSGGAFTAADVGKTIVLPLLGTPGSRGGAFVTTIASYVSATQITLAAAPTITPAAGAYQVVIYGTDDTNAINNALIAAANNGGGRVLLRRAGASLVTGTIAVGNGSARHVGLWGSDYATNGLFSNGQSALNRLSNAIVFVPPATLVPAMTVSYYGSVHGVSLYNGAVQWNISTGSPTTWRQQMDAKLSYNGVGIQVAGDDTRVDENFVAGFNVGIASNGFQRTDWSRNLVDSWTGYSLQNDADVSYIDRNLAKPVAFGNTPWVYNISNVVKNASGGIRITMALASGANSDASNSWKSGDPIAINGVLGTNMLSVNYRYILSMVDANNADLYVYDPTKVGQNFSTSTATMSTFPSGGVYSSGGSAGFNPGSNLGVGFYFNGNAVGNDGHSFSNNFAYGYDTAFFASSGNWISFVDAKMEGPTRINGATDKSTVCMDIGNAPSVTIDGGYETLCGTGMRIDTQGSSYFAPTTNANAAAVRVTHFTFASNTGTTAIDHKSGFVSFENDAVIQQAIVLEDAASTVGGPLVQFIGGDLRGTSFWPQSPADINHVSISAARMTGPGVSTNTTAPGGAGGALVASATPVSLPAPWNEAFGSFYTTSPAASATVTAPIGTRKEQLTPGGTVTSLTQVLPPTPNAGDGFCLASTQDVSAISFTGGTTNGAPSALTANKRQCFDFDGTTWDAQ